MTEQPLSAEEYGQLIQGALEGFTDKIIHPALILTAHHGGNEVLIANAARLYIPDGATVLDCTWSAGRFWRMTDTGRFRLVGSDIRPVADVQADFRQLPYRDECADVIVLDPPYLHDVGTRYVEVQYANSETTRGLSYAGIIDLYSAGMAEALRVLRPGGLCWVKCQDQVASRQCWAVVDLYNAAVDLGFYPRDMFVLTMTAPPGPQRAAVQRHARRNHSYLWVFEKVDPASTIRLRTPPQAG